MGQLVSIKLKSQKDSEIKKVNSILEKMGIEGRFNLEKWNKEWLKDINENPKSPQSHFKPDDRNLTLDELKKTMPRWTEVGLFETDVAFGRTSEEDMQKISKFIEENKDLIEFIINGEELYERTKITAEQKKTIKKLEKPIEKPKMFPEELRSKNLPESGVMLCKSFSPNPFWVIFGKVDEPMFMKEKIYENDLYNNLHRDKNGYAFLLIPLMPLGHNQNIFINNVVKRCWELGLRENTIFFISKVYKIKIDFEKEVGKEFAEFYNMDELVERFKSLHAEIKNTYNNLPQKIYFNERKKKFDKCYGTSISELTVLNSLLEAIKIKDKETFGIKNRLAFTNDLIQEVEYRTLIRDVEIID